MGIFSNMKDKQTKRQSEEKINNFLENLIEIEKSNSLSEKEKKSQKKSIVEKFCSKVREGEIILDNSNIENPLDNIENYFKGKNPIILEIIKEIKLDVVVDYIVEELYSYKPNLDKIEKIILEFYKRYPEDENRNLQLKPFSRFEKYQLIIKYLGNAQKIEININDFISTLKMLYENQTRNEINQTDNIKEKIRIYDEYIRDFLDGVEDIKKSYMIKYFKDCEFIAFRNNSKLCKKYDIEYKDEPFKIYEAFEEMELAVHDKNNERASERLNNEIDVNDLIMIRITNLFPRYGIVETLDKHTMPELVKSPFIKEIKELGLDPKEYEHYSFMSRRTSHWTLNGLVADHEYGEFSGRGIIIVDALKEHINNPGLLAIDESDTYFASDIKLSENAIILISIDKYKELCKNVNIKKQLDNFNVVLFTGSEKIAVEMLLYDLDYVYGEINKWGFSTDRNSPEEKYAGMLEDVMEKQCEILKENGRDVKYQVNHYYSDSRKIDLERLDQLDEEEINKYVDFLVENTDVKFSPKYLKRVFKNRKFYIADDAEHYLDDAIIEDPDLVKMSPKEVFEKIGPEKMKELIKQYNKMILEEHRIARMEKDKILVEMGLLTQEEIENDLEIE